VQAGGVLPSALSPDEGVVAAVLAAALTVGEAEVEAAGVACDRPCSDQALEWARAAQAVEAQSLRDVSAAEHLEVQEPARCVVGGRPARDALEHREVVQRAGGLLPQGLAHVKGVYADRRGRVRRGRSWEQGWTEHEHLPRGGHPLACGLLWFGQGT
jgi:hypothetical protein